jgi:hypothetical protein
MLTRSFLSPKLGLIVTPGRLKNLERGLMGLARLSTQRQFWRCDFDKDFYTYSLPLLRWICASLFANPARNHTRHIIIAAIKVKIKTTHSLSPSSLDLKLFFTNPARIQTWLSRDMYKSSFSLPFFAGFALSKQTQLETNAGFPR